MTSTLLLAAVLTINPVRQFAVDNPTSQRILSADGQRLTHASGFLADMGPAAQRPEDAAVAFLDVHGAAFGVTPRQALVMRGAPVQGQVGAVRFGRTIDGLPVFGGDLVVGVDAQSRVFVVNGADVPPAVSGRHALGEAKARAAALASFARPVRGAGPAMVTAGWRALGRTLRAVYQVIFIARDPPGDWRVFVDAESGAMLFRDDQRFYATAQGSAFEVSPVETAASLCTWNGTSRAFCATPVTVTLNNLATGADLAGSMITAYNCSGADAPASAFTGVPAGCASIPPSGGTVFNYPVDGTFVSTTDDFAGVMAYYQLDKHAAFFKSLDPTLPPGTANALKSSMPALVNIQQAGSPLENAYFSGNLDAMVFGQGASADYSYDATVSYHEFTHGVVHAWGGFSPAIDAMGGLDEPGAVNEGTADAMAVSETGRSELAAFVGATSTPATPYLRDMSDPGASRSCWGNGTSVTRFGLLGVDGLDGEVHDDGEIWNGFYWEIYQGLKAANVKACAGACDAGPALQYKTLQLAGGTSPTFNSYWQTVKSAATALFPSDTGVSTYVDCVAKRRKMDKCDRTAPLFAGESKVQFVRLRFSPFQFVVTATGPSSFDICSKLATSSTVYVRLGTPVQLSAINGGANPPTATVTADAQGAFAQACAGGVATFYLPSSGTWYLLVDGGAGAFLPNVDAYQITLPASGYAARPAATTPATCTYSAGPVLPPGNDGGGTDGGTDGGTGQTPSSGCGCGHPAAGGGIAALVAFAALLRRRFRVGRSA